MKNIAGQFIKCKHCEGEARIILEDRRYFVRCYQCGQTYLLKEQHLTKNPQSVGEVLAQNPL
jgi:translation initiation factor 2 beta subunit (eIF-2beta)/eIF-5